MLVQAMSLYGQYRATPCTHRPQPPGTGYGGGVRALWPLIREHLHVGAFWVWVPGFESSSYSQGCMAIAGDRTLSLQFCI